MNNQEKHTGIECSSCTKMDIEGVRYKCYNCDNFDLCETCYEKVPHHPFHSFIKIDTQAHTDAMKETQDLLRKKLFDTVKRRPTLPGVFNDAQELNCLEKHILVTELMKYETKELGKYFGKEKEMAQYKDYMIVRNKPPKGWDSLFYQ